jgi:Flp pilus assembly CpaF family ATPase
MATVSCSLPTDKWPQSDQHQLRDRIQQRLLAELNPAATRGDTSEVRLVVERLFNETLAELGLPMSRIERNDIFDQLLADILGLGPLEALLADDMVTEILVNGPSTVFIERGGKLDLSPVKFRDNDDVMRIVERIVSPIGRRIDESSPTSTPACPTARASTPSSARSRSSAPASPSANSPRSPWRPTSSRWAR